MEDEGIGILPDQLEEVFEGFHRSKHFTAWHNNGIGPGLYRTRAIARQHGRSLWAESWRSGGTVICLQLPLPEKAGDQVAG